MQINAWAARSGMAGLPGYGPNELGDNGIYDQARLFLGGFRCTRTVTVNKKLN